MATVALAALALAAIVAGGALRKQSGELTILLSEPCDRLTARVNNVWRTGVVQWEKRVPSGMRYVSRAGDVITWSLEMPVNDDGLFGLLCPCSADHRFAMKVQSSRDSSGPGSQMALARQAFCFALIAAIGGRWMSSTPPSTAGGSTMP